MQLPSGKVYKNHPSWGATDSPQGMVTGKTLEQNHSRRPYWKVQALGKQNVAIFLATVQLVWGVTLMEIRWQQTAVFHVYSGDNPQESLENTINTMDSYPRCYTYPPNLAKFQPWMSRCISKVKKRDLFFPINSSWWLFLWKKIGFWCSSDRRLIVFFFFGVGG